MGKIIGIDLGTTNSCVAIMDGNTTRVINPSDNAWVHCMHDKCCVATKSGFLCS